MKPVCRVLVAVCVVLSATPVFAAHVNGSANRDYSGTSTTSLTTAAFSLTTGNSVVVGFRWLVSGASAITGVTDTAGNTYSAATTVLDDGFGDLLHVYYCTSCMGNASNVVTATMSVAVPYWGAVADQYSDSIVAVNTTATGFSSSGPVTTGSFTTTQAAVLLYGLAQVSDFGATWTAGTTNGVGYTLWQQDADAILVSQSQQVATTLSGVTASISNTVSGKPESLQLVAFQIVPVASTRSCRMLLCGAGK